MPTYNYECQNPACKHSFELFQQITARIKRTCPECKKKKLVRLIGSGGGVIFKKGVGGFYCKDYPNQTNVPNDS